MNSSNRSEVVARLDDVSFNYGRHRALDGISVEVGPGITGLLGLNGVGKSTLLRLLATVTTPSQGRVELFGTDAASDRKTLRRRIGHLPQDASWTPSLTVHEFLELFAWMRHLPRRAATPRIERALALTQMTGLAHRRLAQLSGGEHRRAMLAQTLLADPGLLVLDEPTAGLDPHQRVEFRTLLTQAAQDSAAIVSTHLLEDVSTIADRILVVDAGRLLFTGTPKELALRADSGHGDGPPSATALEQGFLAVTRAGQS